MKFDKKTPLYSSEVVREGGEDVLYINYLTANHVPSLADYPDVMERTVDLLAENPNVSRIVFVQQKNYNYDFLETSMLMEIAQLYVYLVKQEKILSQEKLVQSFSQFFNKRYNEVFSFLYLLKRDPIEAYFELKRLLIKTKVAADRFSEDYARDQRNYLNLLDRVMSLLEKTKIISNSKNYFGNYTRGSREIYFSLFKPDIIPNFTFTRLIAELPKDAEIVDQYEISNGDYDKSNVTILRKENESKLIYHLIPPEHNLGEEQSLLLDLARRVLMEHQPQAEEFTDVERTRQVFFNVARDLLQDLSSAKSIKLSFNELNKLATILVRHSIGFGLVEVLLQDENLQDISLNSPIPKTEIFLKHQKYDECISNILPSQEDADSWAAKFRMISGRPLDEANPILDTQIEIGNLRARVAIIQQPLSPDGLAYSIRRHRERPWTLPLFIKNKMLNPLAAGLISFLVDGARTLLIAGTRSSGKTSLLGSLLLEILSKTRIIVVEDSLELPVESLRDLDYNILRMKVRSALLKTGVEVSAKEGIRTSLRLGDSSLIVGEVRSEEALALYEAMRVGALANVVAGTIHGASPYGVFDRVVNDLGVPKTSFKATDIIIVCNPVKSPDGLRSWKRVVQISEVRKNWETDPLEEKGFVDLMKYDVEKDELVPTDDLINGDSEIIKEVASNVKGWAGNWDAVWDNIQLRAKIKEELVKVAEEKKIYYLLEADFIKDANYAFHKISEEVSQEKGIPISEEVFPKWQKWLQKNIEKRL